MKKTTKILATVLFILTAILCTSCSTQTLMSQDDIIARLKKIIPDAEVKSITYVVNSEDNSKYYEGYMESEIAKYDFKLDAYTGNTLSWKKTSYIEQDIGASETESDIIHSNNEVKLYLGEYQVKEIVAENCPNFMGLKSLDFNEHNGIPIYTGTAFTTAGLYYDFEINAVTGEVISLKQNL